MPANPIRLKAPCALAQIRRLSIEHPGRLAWGERMTRSTLPRPDLAEPARFRRVRKRGSRRRCSATHKCCRQRRRDRTPPSPSEPNFGTVSRELWGVPHRFWATAPSLDPNRSAPSTGDPNNWQTGDGETGGKGQKRDAQRRSASTLDFGRGTLDSIPSGASPSSRRDKSNLENGNAREGI